jgi:pyrimidine-specific ribonucleoside hydrolase
MKRKSCFTGVIVVGMLAVLVIVIGPAAPLLFQLGVEPVCIQGDFPQLRVVACPNLREPAKAITPIPFPTLEGQVPTPLIFDDDGSPDGMIALLFFLRNPLFKVEAVTISPGEAHPELFAQHVERLLAAVGRSDIPVGIGSKTPLEGDNSFPEPWRQASDDFWGISLPEAPATSAAQPAAQLIVETLRKSPQPVALFVSGPHTNLAEALRLDPSIRQRVSAVYIMGGSIYTPGNIESDWPAIHNNVAEWNIWVDPVAASEVFASGLPLYMMPLDGTNRITWTQTEAQTWASSGTTEGQLAASLLGWMLQSWSIDHTYIWDLAAAAATTDSRLCPQVPIALEVVIEAGAEQGRTLVEDRPPNARACLEPDVEQIKARVASILAQ